MEHSTVNPKDALFAQIRELCSKKITTQWIESVKTSKGNTQSSERAVIQKIKEVLDELQLTYQEAGSQQSKDFRNVGGIGLDIEVKKSDNTTIYFNDTCFEASFLRSRLCGGDPPILPDRETVTSVTLDQLIEDINKSSDGYCFLRVLEKADRALFLSRVRETDYVDIFQRKAIKLSIWLDIMGSVRLSANYVVYRRAYWDENKGSRAISDRLTNYLVPLWHFDRYEVKSKKSAVEELNRMFQNLMVREPVTRILLRDNHMESFEFSSKYRLSSWENRDYEFPNERYGRSEEVL